MHRLKNCKRGEYDPQAAFILCRCAEWAYLETEDAYAQYASFGFVMVRVTAGHHSVDIATDGTTTVVAFAGTNDISDWLTNLDVAKVDWQGYQVHEGFHIAETNLFYRIAQLHGGDLQTVWITGHSLGGALATLHALRFASNLYGAPAGLYTFGAPRCMDAKSAAYADQLFFATHWRHVNGNDIVTRVPSRLRFKHCGHHVLINRNGIAIHNPSPFHTLFDFVLGYRFDLIRNHFTQKYLIPLMLGSE
jgi:triacylglycerol lipase